MAGRLTGGDRSNGPVSQAASKAPGTSESQRVQANHQRTVPSTGVCCLSGPSELFLLQLSEVFSGLLGIRRRSDY